MTVPFWKGWSIPVVSMWGEA